MSIDDRLVECETLALVDGDGPCRLDRVLHERSDLRALNLMSLLVHMVADVLPCSRFYLHDIVLA